MKIKSSSGFHIVELLLAVAVVAVLGFVGWRVWEAQNKPVAEESSQTQTYDAPEINSTSDLDSASKTVDEIDLSTSDQELSDLEKELENL